MRKEIAESKNDDFQILKITSTVHWVGKLLPGLDVRSSKAERLPIITYFGEKEQLLAKAKLESFSLEPCHTSFYSL